MICFSFTFLCTLDFGFWICLFIDLILYDFAFLEDYRLCSTQFSAKDWKLSRMMKQSGLLFTEKQMLKIVDGLGERGHWKHALSLVEWVYNTKEHKHHKSR